MKEDTGITLVALILTIIILVILSAIGINAVYNTKIIEYAITGTQDYVQEGINENKVTKETEKIIENTVENIKKLQEGGSSNIEPTPSISQEPEKTELTKEELSQEEMIGKYVDYQSAGTDYIVNGTYSGTGTNQTFTANVDKDGNNMKWRIWGVEDNKLLLISETLAGKITLQGADGYNNGVKLLNDACSTAFGNSVYGSAIKARSINQEDIDKVTNMTTDEQRKEVYSSYGSTVTPTYNNYYPAIYAQEPSKNEGGSLERSAQTSWYTGNVSGSSSGKSTCYSYSISIYVAQKMYDALLTNMSANSTSGTDSHSAFWSASRCVFMMSSRANFDVFIVENGWNSAKGLFDSRQGYDYGERGTRPMIEVDLNYVVIGNSGSGTSSSPYSMTKK